MARCPGSLSGSKHSPTSFRRGFETALLLVGLVVPLPAAPIPEPTVCVDRGAAEGDVADRIAMSLDVLAACGHEPRDYRLELRFDGDPEVVFRPNDGVRHHALRVNLRNPCVLTWVFRPDGFTSWQRSVVERAQELARAAAPEWQGDRLAEIEVTECGRLVGLRVRSERSGDGLRVLLDRESLEPVTPVERSGTRGTSSQF